MNAIDKCIPKTQGEHPGEWHEACVSWIDHRKGVVMVSLRHLETGHGSEVPISDVVFGNDAERWIADRSKSFQVSPSPVIEPVPSNAGSNLGEGFHSALTRGIDMPVEASSSAETSRKVQFPELTTIFDTRPAVVSSAPIPSAPSLTAPARVIPSAQFAGRWSGTMAPGRYRMFWLGSQQVVEVSRAADGEMMVTPELGEPMRLADTVQAQFMAEVAA